MSSQDLSQFATLKTKDGQNLKDVIEAVQKIISTNVRMADRMATLKEAGFYTDTISMGSGGVGQVQFKSTLNQARIQVSSGKGKWNFAIIVVIEL